jgi:hypothetical protein
VIDFAGLPEMLAALQRLDSRLAQAAGAGLVEEADRILQVARQLTPVDKGLLVSSGEVEPPVQEGQTVRVTLRFGNHGAVPYAAHVHFVTPDTRHPRGGQHFFLQQPLFEATSGMLGRLADSMRAALGG